ncbi:uncharacterized protein EI90DRAFT_716515 [Cantharellus anzutake]|uniref:uncharacterized protein n=1 Tax=Cantharellus anzutake TaxID=1750568 RepID=UPI0019078533|nr:uncharacterized protein EI90DRAFT_716515 [Cantharellus anzutake]KAF8312406.1 hypothetical protein EI90DRAFT_716515 [Cantharellus anzutake]
MAVTSSLKPLNPNLSNKHSDESVLRSMPKASKSTKGFSGTLADNDENWALSVTSILNQICDRVVEAKRRQFQGIRQSVLIARSEILEEIQEDLRHCLTVSIDHYNCLLELNSQYDAAERDVKSAYDELNHVNTAITEKLQEIIRDHDRLSLCKAMTTLKSLSSRKAISATFESLGVLDGH